MTREKLAKRNEEIREYRGKGLSYRQIGKLLNIHWTTAQKAEKARQNKGK